jgi:hypothetical protein
MPEGLAYKIAVFEAADRERGYRVQASRIPGLPSRRSSDTRSCSLATRPVLSADEFQVVGPAERLVDRFVEAWGWHNMALQPPRKAG